ncbi:MAG TPA: OsmC family protein [Kofleriaceae bacterium]|jgi:organic hydroperoxide reductase OsmC/OhrA
MAEHIATIVWTNAVPAADFAKGRYSREHTWSFDGGATVAGSSSPSVVPLPWSSAAAVDPEEAFVASAASCHMLSFLYVAMKRGFVVTSYRDRAAGVMTKGANGVPWISKITLDPQIEYAGTSPTDAELAELHERAHHECFIANSVKTEIVVSSRHSREP